MGQETFELMGGPKAGLIVEHGEQPPTYGWDDYTNTYVYKSPRGPSMECGKCKTPGPTTKRKGFTYQVRVLCRTIDIMGHRITKETTRTTEAVSPQEAKYNILQKVGGRILEVTQLKPCLLQERNRLQS